MGLKTSSQLVVAILAAAASMEKLGGALAPFQIIRPSPQGRGLTRPRAFRMWRRSSAPQIKQGARECARRQGGQAWDDFRAADRIRRGLPVSWPWARGDV